MSPFKSKAQARYMFANKPKMAKEFAKKTKNLSRLPEHVAGSKPGDMITKMNAKKAANPRKKMSVMGLV